MDYWEKYVKKDKLIRQTHTHTCTHGPTHAIGRGREREFTESIVSKVWDKLLLKTLQDLTLFINYKVSAQNLTRPFLSNNKLKGFCLKPFFIKMLYPKKKKKSIFTTLFRLTP